MNHEALHNRFFLLLPALLLLTGFFSCGRDSRQGFWDTGDSTLDSLLSRADTLDRQIDYDADEAYATYRRIAALTDTASRSARIRSAAYYAKGVLSEFDETGSEDFSAHCYSKALKEAQEDAGAEYLGKRMQFETAKQDTDLKSRTEKLYELLPYFTSLSDSMLVSDIMYRLSDSFTQVWDPASQKDCYREIIRWTPGFNAPLRDLMRFNILAVDRGSTPANQYLQSLDSLACDKKLLTQSPPLGVIIYADRYRLRGNASDLDTAKVYADALVGYHDALKTYWAQRLRHAMKVKDTADAAIYAARIAEHLADSSQMEIETLPILMDYYKGLGDSASLNEASRLYTLLKGNADAHEESSAIAGIEHARKVSDITGHVNRSSGRWILLSAIALASLAGVSVMLYRSHRRRKKDEKRLVDLNSELDNSRRRLVVAEMKNSGKPAEGNADTAQGEWERFEAVFTEMHPSFAEGLRRDFPNLTRNDIRLCAFISMDMDIKHISRMLAIQPDSVKKQMRRLRTKLGLEPAAPLLDFLKKY